MTIYLELATSCLGTTEAIESKNDRDYTFAQFRKAKSPTYYGKSDPLVAERWIRKMEKIFKAKAIPEIQKVNFATQYLEDEAMYWWERSRPAIGDRDATIS